MRSKSKNSFGACAEWQAEIEAVLNADINSEIRTAWENHALKCAECSVLAKDDREIVDYIHEFRTPASVNISSEVMEHINQVNGIPYGVRPQHFVWGLSTALVGFILGFVMSGMSLEPTIAATIEDYFEQTLVEINTGVDSLVTAITRYDEEIIHE